MKSPQSTVSNHAILISAIAILLMIFAVFYVAKFMSYLKTYEKFESYSVVYIYSSSCGFCTRFAPVFKEFSDSSKLNTQAFEQSEQAASKYMPYVSAFPTILILDTSDKMIASTTGAMTLPKLKEWVAKNTM